MSEELRDLRRAIDGVKAKTQEVKDLKDVQAFATAVTRCFDAVYSALDQLKHRHEQGIRD